jgi:hypothetical protein
MRTLNLIISFILLLSVSSVSFAQLGESPLSQPEKSDLIKSITIYPNPATDYVNIKLGSLSANQAKLTLHNILGNEITFESEIIEEHEVRIRVKDLPTGYYFVAVREEGTQMRGTYKFLKR